MYLPLPLRLFCAAILLAIPVMVLVAITKGEIQASSNLLGDVRGLLFMAGMIGAAIYVVVHDPRKRHRIIPCSACKYPNKGTHSLCERCGQQL